MPKALTPAKAAAILLQLTNTNTIANNPQNQLTLLHFHPKAVALLCYSLSGAG
jgi:hypothetical protein